MCGAPPKPKKVDAKPVQYLRNPFLDDLTVGQDTGRQSLRNDLGSPQAQTQEPLGGIPKIADMQRQQLPTGISLGLPGLLIPGSAKRQQMRFAATP